MVGKPRAVPNRTKDDVVSYTHERGLESGLRYSKRTLSRELNRLVALLIGKLVRGDMIAFGKFGYLSVEQYRANGHVLVRRRASEKRYKVGTRIRGGASLMHYNLSDRLYSDNGDIALSSLVVMGLIEFAYRCHANSEKLEIRGLGTFSSKEEVRKNRRKPVVIPAFKPAISLRDRINAELTPRAKRRLKTYEGR